MTQRNISAAAVPQDPPIPARAVDDPANIHASLATQPIDLSALIAEWGHESGATA